MADLLPDLEHPAFRPLDVQRTDDGKMRGIVLVDRLGLSQPTFVPEALLPIVGRFDGERSVAEVCAEATAALGEAVPEDFVRDLVRQLDERLVLHSGRYRAAMAAARDAFLAAGVRPARHAGSAGYPADPGRLRAALGRLVAATGAARPSPRGLIAPHIDLQRGRQGYAAAYGHLATAEAADLYVIFGTGHQGPAAPVTGLPLDWETPLGRVTTDREFLAAVHRTIGPAADDDLFLHRDEHSLEFQVLMLQHLAALRGDRPFQVAAFLCGALPSERGDPGGEAYARRLLAAFRAAEQASGRRVCYVAGADLAHLGPFFGDPEPVGTPLLQRLEREERERLSCLERAEPGEFHCLIERPGNPDRVCSAPAIWLVASLAGGAGKLLHYGQAASPDGSQVVSFCGMAFDG